MTTTLVRGGATFARSSKPSTSFATAARDRLAVDSAQAITLLRFRVDVPAGQELVSAHIEVTAEEVWAGSRTLTMQRVATPTRSYGSITWNNRPSVATGSTAVPVTQAGTTKLWSFDVTTDAALGGVLDWQLTSSDTTTRWLKGPRRATGYPRLVLVTQAGATTPTGVKPAGTISVAAPVVQWTAQAGVDKVQLQVDAVGGTFAAPSFDTGDVLTTRGLVDTAAEGWSGLTAGTSADVRVRQHTASGWSGWSDPVTLTRVAKGTVTISNPIAVDEDGTPPVVWSFTGTQTAWQVIVERNGEVLTYTGDGKQPGTDTSFTPPVGARVTGDVVTRTVRVWDNQDRVESPGDPAYAQASVTSTYQRTTDVAAMGSLAITPLISEDGPGRRLTFSRTPLPDEIGVERDGVIVARLDPTDTTWDDWGHPVNRVSTYKVLAIVNGRTSQAAPTQSIEVPLGGVWLVDPATGRGFTLDGLELQLTYGDVTGTYTAVTAAELISRTTALRGAEGAMTGTVGDWPGRTRDEQVADLWWLRANPRVLRLVTGDLNIPVTVSGLWAAFDPETSFVGSIEHRATFGFRQTSDELPWVSTS